MLDARAPTQVAAALTERDPNPDSVMLQDPMAIFAYLAALVGFVFWLSGLPRLQKFFEITPPIIYAYFLPTLSTAFGILPASAPVYDWMTTYLLPVALLLLMIGVDLVAIARLGWTALIMLTVGTLGIVIGGPLSYAVFGAWLPEDAWMGFAALSGSWIGGTANMVAIAESVGATDAMLGPVIVVDTVVGYGWMGVLLFLSGWQHQYDKRFGARTEALDEANARMAATAAQRAPIEIRHITVLVGLAFAGGVLALAAGARLPSLGEPTIISGTTWAVLLVVTGGLALSFTPVRRLEEVGASRLGYAALYLLLTAIGAKADLRAVLDAPLYLAAGVLWIGVHVVLLFIAARLIRAPLFFVATGSMANVGGAVSAPIVAGVYHRALAPVGLLMAVAGYILGIYAGLACAWLLSLLA